MNVNQRLEAEITIVQDMFHGERWNAQITVTQQSGAMTMLMSPDNVDGALLALEVFAKACRKADDPVGMACLTVDTYYLSMSVKGFESAGKPTLRPGELQERFEAGDKDVQEALNIMVVAPDATATAYLPYSRVGSGIRWKPMIREATMEGRVLEAMREALR